MQLPNRMGQIGINPGLLPDGMPTIGKGVPSQLVLFHQGSLPGALTIVMLLPDSDNVTWAPGWSGVRVVSSGLDALHGPIVAGTDTALVSRCFMVLLSFHCAPSLLTTPPNSIRTER